MSWKNWPYWLKWGLIIGLVFLIPSILGLLIILTANLGYIHGEQVILSILLILIPVGFLSGYLIDISLNLVTSIIVSIIINFIVGFIIGSIIGYLIKKYFSMRKKLSYTTKGFLIGVIISTLILFFMLYLCIWPSGYNILNCFIFMNLISNLGYLWVLLSIILCTLVGWIYGKIKNVK